MPSAKRSTVEPQLLEAYYQLYSRCLPPTPELVQQWESLPAWKLPFHMMAFGSLQEFLLGNAVVELDEVPVQQRGTLLAGAIYSTYLNGKQDYDLFVSECKRAVRLVCPPEMKTS